MAGQTGLSLVIVTSGITSSSAWGDSGSVIRAAINGSVVHFTGLAVVFVHTLVLHWCAIDD